MNTTTENTKTVSTPKNFDLGLLSLDQLMALVAKKQTEEKQKTEKQISDTIKLVSGNKDILNVLKNTNFVKMVVFMDENGKLNAQYMEPKLETKEKSEDGRASKTIMTIHDMAGNIVEEIKNTRKPNRFYEYLESNIPDFKGKQQSYIQEKFKEDSETYLKLLQKVDSNKFRIVL
jgi:hypothetical protein